MDELDAQEESDAPTCLYCWALGDPDRPCTGHRLAVRRAVCEEVC